jgi:hypothetical protein
MIMTPAQLESPLGFHDITQLLSIGLPSSIVGVSRGDFQMVLFSRGKWRARPFLAPFEPTGPTCRCPLTGVERKLAVRSQTDAIDPDRTLTSAHAGYLLFRIAPLR